jgi:hypothetical protein
MREEREMYPQTRKSRNLSVYQSHGQHETERGDEMAKRAHRLIGDTPKADNLTDRFENVNELILCSRGEKGWAGGRD